MYRDVVNTVMPEGRIIRTDMESKYGTLIGKEDEACDRLINALDKSGIKADKLYGYMLLDTYEGWKGNCIIKRAYVNLHYGRCRSYVDITSDFYAKWIKGEPQIGVIVRSGRPRWFSQTEPSRTSLIKRCAQIHTNVY